MHDLKHNLVSVNNRLTRGQDWILSRCECDNQYVGETKQKLSKRLSGHRSAIKKHANTFIAKHFNQPGHSVADILIQPIEKIELLPGESD